MASFYLCEFLSKAHYMMLWGPPVTYGEACVQVGLLFVMTMVRNGERVHCVCQVCLSHLRLSAPYANGQGGWEGQLHGKLLVLIQHVERRRRGVLFNKAPHHHPHQVVHTHSHPASVYAFRTNVNTKIHTTCTHRTPVSFLCIQTDML